MSSLPAAYRLTYDDWTGYPDDGRRYELIEGDLYVSPPPSIKHQRFARDLLRALAAQIADTDLGEVLFAPVGVRLSDQTVLEPDLLVVLRAHAARIGEQVVEGPPDIVVEILSPGTARRDLTEKRAAYEKAAVPEYWIVDPEAETVEVLALRSSAYETVRLYAKQDTLASTVLSSLAIDLGSIFRRP